MSRLTEKKKVEILKPKKSTNGAKKAPETANSRNARMFASEFRAELRKVNWPNWRSVSKASLLILAILIFSTLFIAGIDVLFSNAYLMLTQK